MTLSTKSIKYAVFLSSALLLASNCIASRVDKESLANQSAQLGQGLQELAKTNPAEYCAFDVNYSGNLLTHAATLIQSARYANAQDTFEFVERTLARVKVNQVDCPFFASKIPSYFDKAYRLIRDLHDLAHGSSF